MTDDERAAYSYALGQLRRDLRDALEARDRARDDVTRLRLALAEARRAHAVALRAVRPRRVS